MRNTVALPQASSPPERWIDAFAQRLVTRALSQLTRGTLNVVDNDVRSEHGDGDSDLVATVRVTSPECYRRVAFGGTIGAATAYMDGLWQTRDLPELIRLFVRNEQAHFGLESGVANLSQQLQKLRHFFRRNTRSGSKKNIAEHYDLGNAFYRLFLDPTMAYSCGIFERSDESLQQASERKFDHLCRKLHLSPTDHLLEIGTGWGGFAIYAARHFGCRVTTTTISEEQYALARQRVASAGLEGRVEVLRKDYRDLEGGYDKLVSIEMIEAVGDQYYDTFFQQCCRLLAPDGLMALQTITIADQEFERHRHEVDFIKRYIFPGSCIPSVTALVRSMTTSSDLRVLDLEDITRHYVTTLQRWRDAFWKNIDAVREQGYSERFIRMWDFYLGYCEAGFAERYLGNVQFVLSRPGWRDE